jgi:hypothetical protein
MSDERATIVFSDPLSNAPIDGHASGLGAIGHSPFPMAAGEMDKTTFTAFLSQATQNIAAFSADGSIHFICMGWHHIEELLAAGRDAHRELKNSASGSRTMAEWAHCTAGCTNSSSSSSAPTTGIAIFSSAGLAAIAARSGNTLGSIPLLVAAR